VSAAAATLHSALDPAARYRVRIVDLTAIAQHVAAIHKLSPLASHAMGRALGCAALYPLSSKHHDRVSLQFNGEGPINMLLVDIRALPDNRLGLRGMTKQPLAWSWGIDPRSDRIGAGLLPNGTLTVLQQESSGKASRGQVELVSGEVDADLAAYFQQSEQLDTTVTVRVQINDDGIVRCIGAMVQALPGVVVDHLPTPVLSFDEEVADALARLLGAPPSQWKAVSEQAIEYCCSCSAERALAGVSLLDRDSLIEMIAIDKGATVNCDFCSTVYSFSADDLLPLLAAKDELLPS
jgi:molecular chaperone Hsp33